MIKVSNTVFEIIQTDELALEALRTKLLNLSAYADKIQKNVENAAKKPVKKGTIVAALARIGKNLPKASSLIQNVLLTNIGIKSSLTLMTFKRSIEVQRKIANMHPFLLSTYELFSVTEGPEEITIICGDNSKSTILKHLGTKPKAEFSGLVAVSVAFSEKNIEIPNVIYTLMNALAAKRINILEIVSTYTELSFLIRKEDMETAIKALNIYFKNK